MSQLLLQDERAIECASAIAAATVKSAGVLPANNDTRERNTCESGSVPVCWP